MIDSSEEQKIAEAKEKLAEKRKNIAEQKRLREEELKKRKFGSLLKVGSIIFLSSFCVYAVIIFAVLISRTSNDVLNSDGWRVFLKWIFGSLIGDGYALGYVANILSFVHYVVCFVFAGTLLRSSTMTLKEFKPYFAADIAYLALILVWIAAPINTFIKYGFSFVSLIVVLGVLAGLILCAVDIVKYKNQEIAQRAEEKNNK